MRYFLHMWKVLNVTCYMLHVTKIPLCTHWLSSIFFAMLKELLTLGIAKASRNNGAARADENLFSVSCVSSVASVTLRDAERPSVSDHYLSHYVADDRWLWIVDSSNKTIKTLFSCLWVILIGFQFVRQLIQVNLSSLPARIANCLMAWQQKSKTSENRMQGLFWFFFFQVVVQRTDGVGATLPVSLLMRQRMQAQQRRSLSLREGFSRFWLGAPFHPLLSPPFPNCVRPFPLKRLPVAFPVAFRQIRSSEI